MTAMTRPRNRASLLSVAIVAVLSTGFAVAPAQAVAGGPPDHAANAKISYVALGDSYAAGVGGGVPIDLCGTTPNGYAALLADDPGQVLTDLRGCAGATTADVLGQLEGLDHRTKSVTLTVGANDLGVAALAQTCLTGTPEQCLAAVQYAQTVLLPGLATDLATTLAAIREAAPKATVYVTGYPLLFEPSADPRIAAVNAGIMALNSVIQAAVTAAGPGFVYVDVTQAFAGHGIGSATPWINGLSDAAPFHPNTAGYAAYADAIRAAGFSPAG
ncbi:SGNH/GDSL hydrolase family protein [Agromyces sp. NPDC049794]|uniref:SGNH/GDSL hydrolase family protein n=1 Tax=unclassified Agromyces TaxID=2639701 RepID=UPI00340CB860